MQVQHRFFLLVVLAASAGNDLNAFREAQGLLNNVCRVP